MAMIPRYRLRGLQVTTYDAESDTPNGVYTDIITSEYDPETGLFGKLGTVFSISAVGYGFEVDDGKIDEVHESVAIRYEGASRLCFAPTATENMHPEEIVAFVAWYSGSRPLFYDVDYATPETVDGTFGNGIVGDTVPEKPDRFYYTFVYDAKYHAVGLRVSLNPSFETVGEDYPSTWGSVSSEYSGDPWIMSYVTVEELTNEEPDTPVVPDTPTAPKVSKHIIGYVLRQCGVPMAELIAEMLGKVKKKASLYLYGRPSETGNIGLRSGDTVTLYDGAVLPDISTVYTDEMQEKYPIVVIHDRYSGGSYSHVMLFYTDELYAVDTAEYGTVIKESVGTCCSWRCLLSDPDCKWNGTGNETNVGITPWWPPMWTNTDIAYKDGSTYLEATDPIPVSGLVGYYYGRFDGANIIAPNIDTVYTEELKAEYPYAAISVGILGYGDFYTLHLLSENAYFFDTGTDPFDEYPVNYYGYFGGESDGVQVPSVTFKYNVGDTAWGNPEYRDNNNVWCGNVWANFDWLFADNTVYRAKSADPIPVYE